MFFPWYHLNEFLWCMGWPWHCHYGYNYYKTKDIQMHKMYKQKGWIIWCPHLLQKVLKIWPILASNWKHLPCHAKEQFNKGEAPSPLNTMDFFLASTFGCYYKLVWGEMCYKAIVDWKHKMWLVNWYNVSPMTMEQTSHKGLVMAKRQATPKDLCNLT